MFAVLSYKRDVESADDHQLAILELASLTNSNPREVTHAEAGRALGVRSLPFVQPKQRVYSVDVTAEDLEKLVRRLAFWELVIVRDTPSVDPQLVGSGSAWERRNSLLIFATQTQVLEWTAYTKDNHEVLSALRNGHALERLSALALPSINAAVNSPLTPASRRKNEYLTHGFHKYKAKFFPRLARALINYTCPDDHGVILDPYCGSGTTGVEASLMGMAAVECDIDPLSSFISNAKVILGHLNLVKFQNAVKEIPMKLKCQHPSELAGAARYQLPRFLLERKPKRLTPDVLEEIESQASVIKQIIMGCDDAETKALFELAFSHALATKVSLRWMGTGDNRYALEIASRTLFAIFRAQLDYMLRKLDSWGALRTGGYVRQYGEVNVGIADCTRLPIPDESVNAVVTSPPYLPAASGRETYLRSRAASLIGLGLMTEEAVHDCERSIIGSILAVPREGVKLPKTVTDLVDWMLPQRERTSKARPTTAYFERLGDSLMEMKRVLRPGGMVALVVSKEHMFYEMVTRRVLQRFSMVDAISEMGSDPSYGIGFEVDRVQLLELPKMDFAARPGAQGTYSEAIIFFKKPR